MGALSPENSLDSIHGASGEYTVQGNMCAAVGNCAFDIDGLGRMAHTGEIIAAVLLLLQVNSDWAAGHAARTLGNLAAHSQTSCVIRHHSGMEEAVCGVIGDLTSPVYSVRTRARACHAIANLCGDEELCKGLWMVPDLYIALNDTHNLGHGVAGTPLGAEESLPRALAKLSQVRYGVSTWRVPVLME